MQIPNDFGRGTLLHSGLLFTRPSSKISSSCTTQNESRRLIRAPWLITLTLKSDTEEHGLSSGSGVPWRLIPRALSIAFIMKLRTLSGIASTLLWMDNEEGGRVLSPLVGRKPKLLNREVEEEGLDTDLPPCCAKSFECEPGERRLFWGDVAKAGGVSWLLTCLLFTTGVEEDTAGCTTSFVSCVGVASSRFCNPLGGGVRGGGTENSASGDGRREREGLVCCDNAGCPPRSKSSKCATSVSMSRSTSAAGGVIVGEIRRPLMLRQPISMAFANSATT